jgi:hypothetical protein
VKLLKCAGPQKVSDALTKSLPRPAFEKHGEFMVGTRVPFSAFYTTVTETTEPIVVQFWPMSLSCLFLCILRSVLSLIVRADNHSSARGRAK